MKNTIRTFRKLTSILLSAAILLAAVPAILSMADASTSIADPKTLSNWDTWFTEDSSRYAGGVFLDKSVYTATEALADAHFTDIKNDLTFGEDRFGNENFMVALSALGSTSEILGYSYLPSDTMIVLDASTSMGTGSANSTAIDEMVAGANEAVKRLLALNNYNRVGVVIYNGDAEVLLPLDRYTATNASGNILEYKRESAGGWSSENRIYVANGVKNGKNQAVNTTYVNQSSGTYTQGGIYAAAQQFLSADPVIAADKIQGGTHRIPIMVLMSDGQPSYRTKTSAQTTVDKYNAATNQNCDGGNNYQEDDITAFSTMLTAAWAEAEVSAHYGADNRFYTLGYNLDAGHSYAHNVLDPMNPNNQLYSRFNSFASTYLALNTGATGTFRGAQTFRVKRLSDPAKVTTLDYVDRYWQASNADKLTEAFDAIVDEIVIQSRYYSTLVSQNQHHQDGYISFTDEIGTHMEVKNVKGLYIGEGKLVTGGMFAEFASTGKVSHDSENYSAEKLQGFENEILAAASARFGITLSQASQLITSAKQSGFISWNAQNQTYSNFVAWYADADNNYIAPYTGTATVAADVSQAKYVVRSYFYMGDVTQSHVKTSMLYALVRVREEIATGRQIVDMDLPAALLPLVTYTIKVNGDVFSEENVTELTCTQKKPISLLYEVGLSDEITPYNLTEKMSGQDFRKNADGTYSFFTNRWRSDVGTAFTMPQNPDPHIFNHGIMNTTVAQFIPSLQNERYYYTADTQILTDTYAVYTGSTRPTGDGYFTRHIWVEKTATGATVKSAYNPISATVLSKTGNVVQISGKDGWFVKKGSPEFYFGDQVHGEQAHDHKSENRTGTLGWSNYPQVVHHDSEGHVGYHMLNYLGNNGKVTATPAQGIKLTKEVQTAVNGAPSTFTFRVALSGSGLAAEYPVHIVKANGDVQDITATVRGGELAVSIAAGDTAYIVGLPTGTAYTVTEEYSSYYTAVGQNTTGTVEEHLLHNVHFVNTPKGYGSLLVEKDVEHPFEAAYIPGALANVEFTAVVTFSGSGEDLKNIVDPDGNPNTAGGSQFTVTLHDGESVLFTNIPEGITYEVSETNLPHGFTLNSARSQGLGGTIDVGTQSRAVLINTYAPAAVAPDITLTGDKTVVGLATWTDEFAVALQQVQLGAEVTAVGNPVEIGVMKQGAGYSFDMAGAVNYDKVGTYAYVVYEVEPTANAAANIAYDKSLALFTVTVTDEDVDGRLEVSAVNVERQSAAISGNAVDGWTLQKNFQNVYQADQVEFTVQKTVNGLVDHQHDSGILFGAFAGNTAAYEGPDAVPVFSAITDADGKAHFRLNVLKDDYATAKTYYIREMTPSAEMAVTGMTYDVAWKYTVTIEWADGAAEPTVTFKKIDGTVITADELLVNNVFDDSVVTTPAIELSGNKTLNGGALRANDTFTFKVYETDATFLTTKALLQEKTAAANGAILFDGITFNTAGMHYLKIVEEIGTAGGVHYDPAEYHVTVKAVKVYDANHKAVLSVDPAHGGSVTIQKAGGTAQPNEIDFNNVYHITDTETVVIKGQKDLNGRELIEGEFTFGLYEVGATEPLHTVKNRADGSFAFPALTYTVTEQTAYAAQTFTYEVRELKPAGADLKGVEYDDAVYTVAVTLEDNGDGTLKKTVTLNNQAVTGDVTVAFENDYAATEATLTLSGEKTLVGKNNGTFTFELYETAADFAVAESATPVSSATVALTDGTETYSMTLTYPMAARGYHYYVLREAVPADTEGVHYDVTRYDITVNVLDNGHGEMEAHVMSIVCPFYEGDFTAATLNFRNVYEAKADEYILKGKKLYNHTLEDDMFEFVLSDENGEIARVKNVGEDFTFPAQTFAEAKTYVFTVSEVNGGTTVDGITYDGAVYTVSIPVLDDGKGNLTVDEANITYKKVVDGAEAAAEDIVFQNTYTPADEEVSPVTDPTDPTPPTGTQQPEPTKPTEPEQTDPTTPTQPDPTEPSRPDAVQTGDDANFLMWIALAFVSGAALFTTLVPKKKEKTQE